MAGMQLFGADHSDPQPRFVYECTDPECPWQSPALLAYVAPKSVQEAQNHPHPVAGDLFFDETEAEVPS